MFNKKLLAGATAAVALAFAAGGADAALLNLSGGAAVSTAGISNDIIPGVSMLSGATLTATPGATLSYFYIGSESGQVNQLITPLGTHNETNAAFTWPAPLVVGPGVYAAGPVVDFDDTSSSIWFAYLADGPGFAVSATPTNRVLFALNDSGSADGDFDDYVGYVQAVPLPAAVWLFGSALLGLAGIGYRRKTGYQA